MSDESASQHHNRPIRKDVGALAQGANATYVQSQFGASFNRFISRLYNFFRVRHLRSHRFAIKSAQRTLTKLRTFEGEGRGARVFAYLRKIDPTVFEEMVLTALQDGGRLIRRNRRYSGDGGEDGRFYEPGTGWMLVQCKRYGAHISARHVRDFERLVIQTKCAGGIFVHTGRTGEAAWAPARGNDARVCMISGEKLLDLLLHGRLH